MRKSTGLDPDSRDWFWKIGFWNFKSAILTLTSFFDQPDHPECEFCVPLGSIKPHEELDKNFLSHLTEITLHGNFDFLKVNETKIQKNFVFPR